MSESIISDLTLVRLSEGKYRAKVYKDRERTVPYDLSLLDLLFAGKKKITDPDDDMVFELTLDDGLELDPDITDNNELIITIDPTATVDLSATKPVSIYCELIITSGKRKTLGKAVIPVVPSIKQSLV